MNKLIIGLTLLSSIAYSRSAPTYKSTRALSMGNAFVAVADDKESIYYNWAGLNNMNKLGNYDVRPDLGYYPEDYLDMQINLGPRFPNILGIASDTYDFWQSHEQTFNDMQDDVTAALSADTTLFNDGVFLDKEPITVGGQFSAELAFHNFGGAIWSEVHAVPYIDMGIIIPSAGIYEAVSTVGVQIGGAYEIHPQWSIGLGYRMLKTIRVNNHEFHIANYETIQDTIEKEVERLVEDAQNIETISHGMDVGLLYQFRREIRFGASLQNIFFNGYEGKSVTPELTLGVNYSPKNLNHNTAYARKLNFALDVEDVLNNDRNYKFFSKVNMGFEIEQVLLSYPSLGWAGNLRVLALRGAAGLKGGYWTAGLGVEVVRVITVDFATWAEEGGYFTGQEELRYFQLNLGLGF